ncbi:uncharacterized protein CDV56_100897 [Aspergillus thermomutatus]|uniref:Uncharacterized protein n=1 Tax=Aspergillus thermomutatus TaxID=41047 RepID=A0A397G0M1_ASPTH|nr:uncharacterized protein CDV56_100897 [Aspergillus thermomutatus]RHZ43108.1 hypothetical protein CDV56_100897 [Aspergillus thermomutatus]
MVVIEEKNTYEGYCAQVKGVTDRLAELQHLNGNNRASQSPHTANKGNNNNGNKIESQGLNRTSSSVGGNTMDWEPSVASNAKRAKWVSKEELQRRRDKGLCLRCGSAQHHVANCPFRAPHRLGPKVAEVKVDDAILEDEVADEGRESGNAAPL